MTITFYEPDAYGRQGHRDMPDPWWARIVVYPVEGEDGVRRALEDARCADMIVKTSGVGVFDELLEQAVLECKAAHAVAIFWDVDAPATLDRLLSDPDDPLRGLIPRYDMVLTYGGGEPVVCAYESVGARMCVPIYNALDPVTHYPVAPDHRFDADLGFLGNRLPDRERRVETFFLEAAERLPTHRFLIGGNGWHDKAVGPNVRKAGHVYTRDHNAFNCTPRAVLNVSRESMARYGFSPATRVFEAAGAGACLITDAWEGIECFLEPDTEVLVARDGDEVGGARGRTRCHPRAQARRCRKASRPCRAHLCASCGAVPCGAERALACLNRGLKDQTDAVVIFGLTISSSWGNGHATLWRGLCRALQARRHRVIFFERDVSYYASHRDQPQPQGCDLRLYSRWEDAVACGRAVPRFGRYRDGYIVLPGRTCGGGPGARFRRGVEGLLRSRHADHAGAPPRGERT